MSGRRRLAALVLLAASLVLAGSGCGSGHRKAPVAANGRVPWRNRPLPLYRTPDATLIRYPTSAPPCRATQVRIRQGRTAAELSHQLNELVFTNVSAKTCLLRGNPTISARAPDGVRRTLRPTRRGTYFGQMLAADIQPGAHGLLDFDTTSACDNGVRRAVHYRDMRFTLPNGGVVSGGNVSISEVCGLSISELGLPKRYAEPRARLRTAGTLVAHLRLPASVRAGATLHYAVTLSNWNRAAVALSPCPGYTQGLYIATSIVRQSFALNCATVRAIPPHGRVRYAMRLVVPRRAKAGYAKISWSLNTPTGPFAGGVVEVVSR